MEGDLQTSLKLSLKRSKLDDDGEIILLDEVSAVAQRLQKADTGVIPTLTFILKGHR